MENIRSILIFHAAAIGDTVLATPVSLKLKAACPQATVRYLTHESLFPLLRLCSAIDFFHPYSKSQSIFEVRQLISSLKPDLIVDLSGSVKSIVRTAFLAPRVLHYRKQGEKSRRMLHAVDNYLDTLSPLGISTPSLLFPSLSAGDELLETVKEAVGITGDAAASVVALVPGVGTLRPHRAWGEENWIALSLRLLADGLEVLLIGGPEDRALCDRIQVAAGDGCKNLAGKFSLPETAALLSLAVATVSGDTGPAHISVATGTPVVGIYGPTYAARSGPYGMEKYVLDVSSRCRCLLSKQCTIAGADRSGSCLAEVSVAMVYAKLESLLRVSDRS
ncbi:MAG: glycosyltransferase family 9 protein [Candidatus Obscuribacterales bacterium]|nr:glycosyltransferase family 9 protein [Candidatus Obscuribacterales bacterium]